MTALARAAAQGGWPDYDAATTAHDALVARPALGRLAALVEWLAGVQSQYPVREITRSRLILVAGDHPIVESGVSRLTADDTSATIAAVGAGSGPLSELAAASNTPIRVEEVDPEVSTEVAAELGAVRADQEIDAGADLLIVGSVGAGSTTMAAAVIAVLTATEPIKVVGRGGRRIDDLAWMHKVGAIRDARRRGWPHRDDPAALLAELACPDIAFVAGLLLRAGARRTPVLIDGVVTAAAALVGNAVKPGAARWWQAAQLTGEPAQAIALHALTLDPIVDFGMATGDGSGGLVALGVVQAALALVRADAQPNSADA